MTYDEVEIVADAGTRLRIIADGLLAACETLTGGEPDFLLDGVRAYLLNSARHVDEVRVRLCALPIEAEGEAA